MMYTAAPELVAYRHYAKLTLGLKALIVMNMIHQNNTKRSICVLVNTLFPDPATHPYATQRDHMKISEAVNAFKGTVQGLPIDQESRQEYFKAELEKEYGEDFMVALEKLLKEYFVRLESTMRTPRIQELQESMKLIGYALRPREKPPSTLSILLRYFSDMGWAHSDPGSPRQKVDPHTASCTPQRWLRSSGSRLSESSEGTASRTPGGRDLPHPGREEEEEEEEEEERVASGRPSMMKLSRKCSAKDEEILKCACNMLNHSLQGLTGAGTPIKPSIHPSQIKLNPPKLSLISNENYSSPSTLSHKPWQVVSNTSVSVIPSRRVYNLRRESHELQTLGLSQERDTQKRLKPLSALKAVTMDIRVSLVNIFSHLSQNTFSVTPGATKARSGSLIPELPQRNTVLQTPGYPPEVSPSHHRLCLKRGSCTLNSEEKTCTIAASTSEKNINLFSESCQEKTVTSNQKVSQENSEEGQLNACTPNIKATQCRSSFHSRQETCPDSVALVMGHKGATPCTAHQRPAIASPPMKRRRLFRPEEVAGLILEEPKEGASLANIKCNLKHIVRLGPLAIHAVPDPHVRESEIPFVDRDKYMHNCENRSCSPGSDDHTCCLSRKRARSPESLVLPKLHQSPLCGGKGVGKEKSADMKLTKPLEIITAGCGGLSPNRSENGIMESDNRGVADTSISQNHSNILASSTAGMKAGTKPKEQHSAVMTPSKNFCQGFSRGQCLSPKPFRKTPKEPDTDVILDSEDEDNSGSSKVSLQNYQRTKFNTYIPTFREHFKRTPRWAQEQVLPKI
ncbi:TERF1-interacting nuclear factor 2 isoform X2 [Ambystoma mexicanum]